MHKQEYEAKMDSKTYSVEKTEYGFKLYIDNQYISDFDNEKDLNNFIGLMKSRAVIQTADGLYKEVFNEIFILDGDDYTDLQKLRVNFVTVINTRDKDGNITDIKQFPVSARTHDEFNALFDYVVSWLKSFGEISHNCETFNKFYFKSNPSY